MSSDYTITQMLDKIQSDLVRAGIEWDNVFTDVQETAVVVTYADPIELAVRLDNSVGWSLTYFVQVDGGSTIWEFDLLSSAVEQVVNLYQIQTGERRA